MVQHNAIDHTGITGAGGSFGSNANQVSTANAPGASTLHSAADHVHRGVSSIAHASNTFYGPVTFTTEGDLGITSPSTGTLAFKAISGAGGAGSSDPAFGVVKITANQTDVTGAFVDITSASITLTTAARRCRLVWRSTPYQGTAANYIEFTFSVDAVDVEGGPADGMSGAIYFASTAEQKNVHIEYVTPVLSAGSHTFKARFRRIGGTANTGAAADAPAFFRVEETSFTT